MFIIRGKQSLIRYFNLNKSNALPTGKISKSEDGLIFSNLSSIALEEGVDELLFFKIFG